ncbi:hypothetical protein J5N97_021502 [Dioscorea zingiberensis]|uniref:RNA polymerase II C-terminal domain phosphatase-like n=1 Tax=Dioscorea zingiberensis TaxID=325984 RepID=A0A9D5CHR4_9LILI|nr:hypothetical protein J5N97_021502 [Dioscorea zingiberensis]
MDVRYSSASKSNDQESASTSSSSCQLGEGDISSANDNQQEENTVEIDEEMKEEEEEEQNKSFLGRKLSLVLDLDHTLLHSIKAAELDRIQDEKLFKMIEQELGQPQRHLFCLPGLSMWTKLRPGIWNFLDKASKLYELHVYTLGMKSYAAEIVKILDPTGTLFQGRVISRGDKSDLPNGGGESSLIKDFNKVQRLESDVLIMDDTINVWPHNQRNLIAVKSYNYFPESRQPYEPCEPSFLESDSDERADIGTLSSLLTVIERIHREFFSFLSLEGIDVRNTLASQKRRILSGCKILFSGISSMNEDKPHLHPLWQTCQEFGAVCTTRIDQSVTHVVAECFGAEKVKWAHFNGKFIVNPEW